MEEKEIAERALGIITSGLKKEGVVLPHLAGDERLSSAVNEGNVKRLVRKIAKENAFFREKGLRISDPNEKNNRAWYDFAIEGNGIFIPVNIKITSGKCPDNLSCKLGIFYALTGKRPESAGVSNGIGWEDFAKALAKGLKEKGKDNVKDYYFLVVSKNDNKDVFFSSLKTLQTLTPNASNLPFQCKWKENRKRKERGEEEARAFVLGAFKKSLETRKEEIIKTCAVVASF